MIYPKICNCGVPSIGETKRRLSSRIKEHGRPTCESAISEHISECKFYRSKLDESHGDQLNPSVKFNFLKDHFKVLHQNLNKYNQRKTFEAVCIKMLKPKLNEQVKSRSVNFI